MPIKTARTNILPSQRQVLEHPAKYLAIHGGLGAAKTRCLCVVAFRWLEQFDRAKFSVWSETYPKLMESIKTEFDKLMDELGYVEGEDYSYNKTSKIYYWPNGSRLHLKSYDIKEGRIRAPEWDGILVDEANLMTENKWRALKPRVRAGATPGLIRIFGNAVPPLHWFASDFEGSTRVLNHDCLKVTSYANPFLTDEDITDLEATYPPHTTGWKRWMMGENVALEGAVYHCFDSSRHIVDDSPDKVIDTFHGLDLGTRDPSVLLTIETSDDGKLYVVDEYVSQPKSKWNTPEAWTPISVQTQALEMKPRIVTGQCYSDHSLTMRTAFEDEGITTIKAMKDVNRGIAIVNKLFQNDILFIKRGAAPYLEKCLQLQVYKQRLDKDEPDHNWSHANDSLRYAVGTYIGEVPFDANEDELYG